MWNIQMWIITKNPSNFKLLGFFDFFFISLLSNNINMDREIVRLSNEELDNFDFTATNGRW